jgi:hypothetical protein
MNTGADREIGAGGEVVTVEAEHTGEDAEESLTDHEVRVVTPKTELRNRQDLRVLNAECATRRDIAKKIA